MRTGVFLGAVILLGGCLPGEDTLRQQAGRDLCGSRQTAGGQTVLEMPPEDLGRGNVGFYTFASGTHSDTEYGRYALLNCASGKISRVEVHADAGAPGRDVRQPIEALRRQGAMQSVQSVAQKARQHPGLSVTEGVVARQAVGRANCACMLYYPQGWSAWFPPGSAPVPVELLPAAD